MENEFDHLREAQGFQETWEWKGDRDRYLLGIREHGFSIYAGNTTAVHFDLEGRLRRAFIQDATGWCHYLRGYDGRLLRKRKVRRGDPPGQDIPEAPLLPSDGRMVFEETHALVRDALESFPDSRDRQAETGDNSPREVLARAASFEPERLEGEASRFLEAYRPIGILPPDRYLSLILQATEGCAYNGCLFCSLYRDQRYRAKEPEEFRGHIRRVKSFLGRALPSRKGVFLGEANALAIPQRDLLNLFQVLHEELPVDLIGGATAPEGDSPGTASGPGGISSFIDAFTTRDKGSGEFAELQAQGLRRVFLGVESGQEELLSFLKKPASNEGVQKLVEALKNSGISMGIIFLVGVGGKQFEGKHIDATVGLVKALPLDAGDMIYLSPLVVEPGGRYEKKSSAEGITPLTPGEVAAQDAELRKLLRPKPGEKGPKVTRYDIQSFVY